MKIYEVKSTNLDVNDGIFSINLYSNIDSALAKISTELKRVQAKDITDDLEGKLKDFDGRNLEWCASSNKPAVYYRSYYGNYRCVTYIQEVEVLD